MRTLKFTKASRRDGENTVTVGLSSIMEGHEQGDEIVLVIKSRWSDTKYKVRFTCNRKSGATFKTTEWPKRFAKPEVGQPVEYKVFYMIMGQSTVEV